MSETIQNIGVVVIAVLAIGYLVKKYVWNPFKKNNSKNCDSNCEC